MAISNLLTPKPASYSSLMPPAKQYGTLASPQKQFSTMTSTPQTNPNLATSVATGKGTPGVISGTPNVAPPPAPQPVAQAQTNVLPQVQPQAPVAQPQTPVAPQTPPPQQTQTQSKGLLTYPSITSDIAETSRRGSPVAQTAATGLAGLGQANPAYSGPAFDAYTKAVQDKLKFQESAIGLQRDIYDAPTSNRVMQGRAAQVQQANAATLAALQGAVQEQQAGIGYGITGQQTQQTALTGAGTIGTTAQGLQQAGLTSAAGLTAPQQVGYNVQYTDPLTGLPYGGGATGGSLQSAVANVTQQLQSGQIGYEAAKAQLSGYGQGGLNALSDWANKNNFNIAQSEVLAGQQGSIKPAFEYAKIALNNLQSSLGNLMVGQATNIPIINSITQGVSTTFGVGSEAVQNYKAAIAEARNAIQKVLASVQGGTPTDYVGQSNALLPDNATPNQINAAQSTLETLGAAKVGIYGNPGASAGTNTTQNAPSTSGSIWSF